MDRETGGEAEDEGELVVSTVESLFVNPRLALCGLALILAVGVFVDYLFSASYITRETSLESRLTHPQVRYTIGESRTGRF